MNEPNSVLSLDTARLERTVNRLATERAALFDKAGTNFGLSADEHSRLATLERELDECFHARRLLRADRDARRFDRETFVRAPIRKK